MNLYNKRLMIIGDSLVLPRDEVIYTSTWIYMLKQYLKEYDIIDKSQHGAVSTLLNSQEYLEHYLPDKVIIQLGICDCAPRYVGGFLEECIVSLLPPGMLKLYKRARGQSEKRAKVKIENYESNFRNYLERAKNCKVEKIIIIKIGKAGYKYLSLNRKVQQSIDRYNLVLEKIGQEFGNIVTVIDPIGGTGDVDSITLQDGYHLNEIGNKLVFQSIKEII